MNVAPEVEWLGRLPFELHLAAVLLHKIVRWRCIRFIGEKIRVKRARGIEKISRTS